MIVQAQKVFKDFKACRVKRDKLEIQDPKEYQACKVKKEKLEIQDLKEYKEYKA